MNISQWKNGDRTFFSLEVDDRLLLMSTDSLCAAVRVQHAAVPAHGRVERRRGGVRRQDLPRDGGARARRECGRGRALAVSGAGVAAPVRASTTAALRPCGHAFVAAAFPSALPAG